MVKKRLTVLGLLFLLAWHMYILRDAFLNELHFDGKNLAPKFNFRSQNHDCREKKGVNIIPTHSKNPVMIPQLDKLALKNVFLF